MIIDSKVTLACIVISAVAVGFYVWNRTSMLSTEIQECIRRLDTPPSCPVLPPPKEKKKAAEVKEIQPEKEPAPKKQ